MNDHLKNLTASPNGNGTAAYTPPEPLAIIGISCRLPGGVTDPESYWKLLCDGIDAIEEVPTDRWDTFKFYDPEPGKQGKIVTKWGGFVKDVDKFDPAFFGISPREAAFMDPQQRQVLEATWEALEDGGQRIEDLAGTNVGVFVGVSTFDYGLMQASFTDNTVADAYTNTGQALSISANRISYVFNFKGPSTILDTACSSSLLAAHFAAESIWRGESHMAVVCGVNFLCTPATYIGFSAMGMLSPEGRCKAFDASASGFVRAEGVGSIILKPLSRALADGDKIYAMIAGTACNQDGRTPGMTVPSQSSQEMLVRDACRRAGISPLKVRYMEAHGTGTLVGDPIEARALGAALCEGRPADEPCIMGSVKANIGHLESGSGIAGLIKAALVLKHRQVPPNVHYVTPNPDIDFDGLRLKVPTELMPLPEGDGPAYAGVNSFGFGGTNVHTILQEPPRVEPAKAAPVPEREEGLAQVVPLSARAPEALQKMAQTYVDALQEGGLWADATLHDIASTCARRRSHHDHRMAVVAHNKQELLERLSIVAKGENDPWVVSDRASLGLRTPLAFVFSGQGPQWWAMGRQLLEQEPVFRDTIERCDAIVRQLGPWSLLEELTADEEKSRIPETTYAQPAIFAVQAGLFELWKSWGIQPDIVVGHSVGEVAAAYAAGVLSLEDAVKTIYHRGRTMDLATERGKMLAAGVTAAEAEELVKPYGGKVGIAALNSPNSVTLSGDGAGLEEIDKKLQEKGAFSRFLQVNYAFHSYQMEPVQGELLKSLADIKPQKAKLPIISTVTGQPVEGPEMSADYWWQNVRQSVRFADAMDRLMEKDFATVVEVSPHPVLMGSINECYAGKGKKAKVVISLRRKEPERAVMLRSLGALYGLNCPVDWDAVAPKGRFVELPVYPWIKDRYWHESPDSAESRLPWKGHRILGFKTRNSKPTFQGFFDTRIQPFVLDHKIQGHVLMPGTGFCEVGLALGKEMFGENNFVLTDVKLLKAAFMPEGYTSMVHTIYEPQTGMYTIASQPMGQTGRPWTTHVVGYVRERTPIKPRVTPTLEHAQKRCSHAVTASDFYEFASMCGFPFGPSFQGMTRQFLGSGEMLSFVEAPELVDKEWEHYIFHPAMLDACLQPNFGCFMTWNKSGEGLNLKERMKNAEIFMPSSYDEIRLYKKPQKKMWAYVRMLERSRDLSHSDVFIFDEQGELVCEVRGFEETLVGTTGGNVERSADLLYEYDWKFLPRAGATEKRITVPPLAPVAAAVKAEAAALLKNLPQRDRIEKLRAELDDVAADLVFDVLQRLGAELTPGQTFTAAALADKLGVAEPNRRALNRFLGILVEDGLLKRSGDAFTVVKAAGADPLARLRGVLGRYPMAYAEVALLARCAKHLPAVLKGEKEATSLLYPNGLMDVVDQVMAESPEVQFDFALAGKAVAELLKSVPEGRTVRVLDLRAGMGEFAAAVLPNVPADYTEYVFTDLTDKHFPKVQEQLGKYPFVKYQPLDVEKDPAEQGFAEHSFDLVVASEAFHPTADVRSALANVKKLLASGGAVLFVEPVAADRTADLTFGLDPANWRFTDTDLRGEHFALPADRWQAVLAEAGFTDVTNLAAAGKAPKGFSHAVFFARGPESAEAAAAEAKPLFAEPGKWLVFADKAGVADRLAGKLRAHGETTVFAAYGDKFEANADGSYTVNPDSVEDFQKLLTAVKGGTPALRGLAYCWMLDVPTPKGEDFAAALDRSQTFGAVALVNLTQAWMNACGPEKTNLWLVSRGSQPAGKMAAPPATEQSTLWGMGRVVINEFGHLNCKLADLGTCGDEEVGLLVEEIAANLPEDEVAFRGEARYVHRFVSSSLEKYAARGGVSGEPYRLHLSDFGVLDQMKLRPAQLRRPLDAPTVIEVEVKATALNFSDVMKALGLYPGLQQGIVPVGIECAGVVTAVGDAVKDFKVGDEVVCISPLSLASHAYTDHRLAAHKPKNITFEEAATIPIAFLTAHYALNYIGRMEPGEKVLVHAATGGVGLAAIQLANNGGAEVFATAGTTEKRELLEFLGVKHIMDSRTLTFAEEVLEKTKNKGVDLILNSLSGEAIGKGMTILADYGRFLEIGKRDIYANSPLGMRSFRKNVSFAAIDLDRGLREKPDLCGRMFKELMRDIEAGKITPLPHRVFPITEVVDAFRYMAKAKHTGKVIVSMQGAKVTPSRDPVETTMRFKEDATYLVTGGLGGFGVPMAQWMAENGARNMVLCGRRGVYTDEARAAIDSMQRLGVNVEVAKTDVSKPEQVKELIEQIKLTMPPLKGVMHAAVVLDDALIMNLNRERVEKVLGAKMMGAWYLHEYTKDLPLDFFVCYSSTSAVFGNPGQGNYSAANTFLDYLAHHRRALGLPALTINWGYLGEIGVAAGNKKLAERFEAQGVKAVPPSEGLPLLGRLMAQGANQVSVMRMDWNRMRNMGLGVALSPRFSSLVKTVEGVAEGGAKSDGAAVRKLILAAAPEQRKEILLNVVRDKVARVLGTSPSRIEVDRPLMDLGLDSLMGVELRNWIEGELRVNLPVVELMQGPTVQRLTDLLLVQLAKEESDEETGVVAPDALQSSALTAMTRGTVDPKRAAEFGQAMNIATQIGAELQAQGDLNLRAEAVLPNDIQPAKVLVNVLVTPQHVFMTGTTGFLGAYLLGGLLAESEADFYCLVRAKDEAAGLEKIKENLVKYGQWHPKKAAQIKPVLGDLAKPFLGLTEERFNELAAKMDVVYHNGAMVEFVYPYHMMKPVNVAGTIEMLRFGMRGRVKPFHHVSTLAIFSLLDHLEYGTVRETDKPNHPEATFGGYIQSKWVSDTLVDIARERGLPVTIYRPGIITGDSETGVGGTDVLSLLLQTAIQIGAVAKGRSKLTYTPVDYVGKAIVNLSKQPHLLRKNCHLVNPVMVEWMTVVEWVRAYGYSLEEMSYNDWRARLKEVSDERQDTSAYGLLPLIPELQLASALEESGEETPDLHFDCKNVEENLKGTGITCPPLNAQLLYNYLNHFVESGKIPPPANPSLAAKAGAAY